MFRFVVEFHTIDFLYFLFRTLRRYPSFSFLSVISDEYTRTETTGDVDNFSEPKKAHKHCHTVTKWPSKGLRFPQLLHLRVIRSDQLAIALTGRRMLLGPKWSFNTPTRSTFHLPAHRTLHTESRLLCSHRLLMLDRCYYWLRQLDRDIYAADIQHTIQKPVERRWWTTQCCCF